MLKERREFIKLLLYISELLIAGAGFFGIYYLFFHIRSFYHLDVLPGIRVVPRPRSLDLYLRAYWLSLVIWSVILRLRGEYHLLRFQSYRRILQNYLLNGLLFFVAFAGVAFFFKFTFLSRMFVIVYTVSTVFLLMAYRLAVLSVAYAIRRRGLNYRNLLLVGTGRRAQTFIELISRHKEWGYRIIGMLDRDPALTGSRIQEHTVLGTMKDLPQLLNKNVVDEVVFVVPRSWLEEIEKCILYCEAIGVPATLSTDFFDLEIASGVPKEMEGFTYLTFETRQLRDPELLLKRLSDVLLSAFFLVVFSPVFIAVIVLVKSTSRGPVFFKQRRSGRTGREFTLYKFRSMVPDAEAKLEELRGFNQMSGPVFKMEDDPRMTRVGRWLRRTSLDELPQFWNVLKGDMSLVGPRPPLASEVARYEPWQRR
ncbi:MAG TPA: sugar transferase, partial [Candidatus Eisenbacteria bacterium]|nr:sugar transferase [Candidatus Eisenbacteria bacterium]